MSAFNHTIEKIDKGVERLHPSRCFAPASQRKTCYFGYSQREPSAQFGHDRRASFQPMLGRQGAQVKAV
jgi:hypothetical protein